MSKRLFALISASARRYVLVGCTLLSMSPVISIKWPLRFFASSEFFSMSNSNVVLPSFSISLMPWFLAPAVVVDVVLVIAALAGERANRPAGERANRNEEAPLTVKRMGPAGAQLLGETLKIR